MSAPTPVAADRREKLLASIDLLPPFSPVLAKVMASLANEDVSFAQLATLIENDTVLAGTILRVVNSPLYGRRATVNSVRHALSIVGMVKIRNLVLGLSVTRRWATARVPRRWSARLFNLHALACGVMADLIVLHAPAPYAEGAFAAGLLHDIGRLLTAIAIPEDFEKLHQAAEREATPMRLLETEWLGVSHAEVSGWILERWNLPMPIREAVTYHHAPEQAAGGALHLAHVVQTADRYVTRLGYTLEPPPADADVKARDAPGRFGLEEVAHAMGPSFQEEFDALRAVL